MDRRFHPWFTTFFLSAWIFIVIGTGFVLRRGSVDVFVLNQVFASTSLILISLSLVLGPLGKFFNVFDRFVARRRELGIWGFVFAYVHILLILFALRDRFPWSEFAEFPLSFIAAIVALVLLCFLTFITPMRVMRKMGPHVWRKSLRYASYAALLAILLHTWEFGHVRWERWIETRTPLTPPMGLIVFAIGVIVFLFRCYTWVYDLTHKKPTPTQPPQP
jgi:DMSO/TMAO reductase YedYZ heme-binding membrane subunit